MGIALCFMGVIYVDHDKFQELVHSGKDFICDLDFDHQTIFRGDLIRVIDKDSTKVSLRKRFVDFEVVCVGEKRNIPGKDVAQVHLKRASKVLRLPER